ncbi:sensor histidine kinase [Alienimonas chondri]|uniref:histidine kinase n=1 Tax=Alienimonas chondri TaxID=2681879 RepID=A0ABX1V7Z8_9PLAN|nr:hybrid sensor histidine kinase/response regulator [Alienimonas chondri]NNJ24295.1 Adaptive-response sensory-kinase SasA [Alienimonas chondri]
MQSPPLLRVLVVEDADDHYELLRRRVGTSDVSGIELHRETTLAGGLRYLTTESVDAVLLDLGLPDSEVGETLERFKRACPTVALVALTSLDDLNFAAASVAGGAQDFLVKSQLSRDGVVRSLRYAVERKQTTLALERSNQELRNFAHTVAHEVRHPAAAALMALSAVRLEPLSDQSEEVVALAEESLRTLSDLVRELLDFAEIEHSSSPPEAIDLNLIIDRVLDRFRPDLDRARARVEREPLPTVTAHAAQLSLLFQNLIGNAIKYRSPERDLVLKIGPAASDRRGVRVTDNGRGIEGRHLPKLFDVFYRGDPPAEVTGTGVGLALCRRIAQRYGGDITIQSIPQQGSTFEATFGEPAEANGSTEYAQRSGNTSSS